jgi:hypothetical protein
MYIGWSILILMGPKLTTDAPPATASAKATAAAAAAATAAAAAATTAAITKPTVQRYNKKFWTHQKK